MDYTKKLFEYFENDQTRMHLIVSPHAPPVERLLNSITVALDAVWDEVDIDDTIIGLKTYGEIDTLNKQPDNKPNSLSGIFSLSIKGAGKFRISYFTQRGSKAFSMERIPFNISSFEELNLDKAIVDRALELLCDNCGGIVAVFGPSEKANSKFVYSLLKDINSKENKVILATERELTYLLRHDNSIVVQRELGSDFETMDDCIREGLNIKPDIIFAGDILLTDHIPSMVRAVETQTNIIISLVASEKKSFLHILKSIFNEHAEIIESRIQEVIQVIPQPDGNILAKYANT